MKRTKKYAIAAVKAAHAIDAKAVAAGAMPTVFRTDVADAISAIKRGKPYDFLDHYDGGYTNCDMVRDGVSKLC